MKNLKRALADRPLYCVIWDDAHGVEGEHTAEVIARDYHQPQRIPTFGLLIQDDERGITLASEVTSTDMPLTYRGLSFIPRGMIVEAIDLGIPMRPLVRKSRKTHDPELVRILANKDTP